MRKLTTLLLMVITAVIATAQVQIPKVKFGEVSTEDLKMTVYPKDSSADAVVLYEYGETRFGVIQKTISTSYYVHRRIKILKKSAVDKGSFNIYFTLAKEDVSDIKGYTYNDNLKEKLTKDMIFNEKSTDNISSIKVSMPNVKVGSIIEFSYKIESKFINSRTWAFQDEMPVRWSEYKISYPSYFYFRNIMSGYLQLTLNENKQVNIHELDTFGTEYHYAVADAPAFKDEPYITTSTDYISKIDFELTSIEFPGVISKNFALDYPSLNKTLMESEGFGETLKRKGPIKDIVKELKSTTTDTDQLLHNAYDYVRKNFKSNDKFDYYTEGFKKVIEKKEGSVGDINLLLVAILQELGFNANPLILSTRGNGRIHEIYALQKRFNYVVVHVALPEDKVTILDATNEFVKFGMVPKHVLNHLGWVVTPTGGEMVSLEPKEKANSFKKIELKITDDFELKGKLDFSLSGYDAWEERKNIKKATKDKHIENIKKNKPSWNIVSSEIEEWENPENTLHEKFEVDMSDYITNAGNMLYLKPLISECEKENPFKTDERVYPIDFGMPIEQTISVQIEIPSGYTVVEHPKNILLTLPENSGRFSYNTTKTENKITILSRFQLKYGLYLAEGYPLLKEFYNKVIEKQNEQIVLKKM